MYYNPERLFRPKLVRELVNRLAPHTASDFQQKKTILRNWRRHLDSSNSSESQLESAFAQHILGGVLGYQGSGGGERLDYQFKTDTGFQKFPDLVFGKEIPDQGWQASAILELKSPKIAFDHLQANGKTPVEQAWGYANNLGNIQWVLLSDFRTFRLYSYRLGQKFAEEFDLFKASDTDSQGTDEYNRIMSILSRDSLIGSGYTEQLLKDNLESQQEITNEFYYLYTAARHRFRQEIIRVDPEIDRILALTKAQTLLNRIIFISFCENSLPPLLTKNLLSNIWNKRGDFDETPPWTYFLKYFRGIERGSIKPPIPAFNGGLFQPDAVLDSLPIDFDRLQPSVAALTNFYFTENLSVTILGNIFENSIDDIEQEKAADFEFMIFNEITEATSETVSESENPATETAPPATNKDDLQPLMGKRKIEGVVYTPDTVARYIVESTLVPKLNQLWLESLSQCAEPSPELDAITAAARALGGVGFSRYDSDHLIAIKWQKNANGLRFWEAYCDRVKTLRIIDPSCGSGAFLVMTYQFLKGEFVNIDMRRIHQGWIPNGKKHDDDLIGYSLNPIPRDKMIDTEILAMLYGSDLNSEAVEISKLSLWIKTAYRGKRLDFIEENFRVGDSLLAAPQSFFPEIMATGGFDIVVGNPPYVRQELVPAEFKQELQKHYQVFHGQADLYCYFYELGLRLLKPGGYLGFITSSSFMKTGFASKLRHMLRTQTAIHLAVDLGDNQYFNRVTTYPMILVTCKEPPDENHNFLYSLLIESKGKLTLDEFAKFSQENQHLYPQNALTDGEWQLEKSELRLLRLKITLGKKRLFELDGEPISGIKTGYNEAFVINQKTRDRLVREVPKSTELIKPLLGGVEIRRWYSKSKDQFLICIPCGWSKKNLAEGDEKMVWQEFEKLYPSLAKHLLPFQKKAQRRTDMGDYWWELRSCNYYDLFEQPKIVWPKICNHSRFLIESNQYYLEHTLTFLNSNRFELMAYLNSNLVWFYLTGIAGALRGGRWRYQLYSSYTRTIPIPDLEAGQRDRLAELGGLCQSLAEGKQKIGADFEPVVMQYLPPARQEKLSRKQREWWSHSSFETFSAESRVKIPPKELAAVKSFYQQKTEEWRDTDAAMTRTEAEINRMVYEIFELTPAEIRIIEDATKGLDEEGDE